MGLLPNTRGSCSPLAISGSHNFFQKLFLILVLHLGPPVHLDSPSPEAYVLHLFPAIQLHCSSFEVSKAGPPSLARRHGDPQELAKWPPTCKQNLVFIPKISVIMVPEHSNWAPVYPYEYSAKRFHVCYRGEIIAA